jgi:hypothetical protein
MARKKKPKNKLTFPTPPPRFAVGDRVRVRSGTHLPDYPDIPLGGWAGVIEEHETPRSANLYLVCWNDGTLEAMPAIFRMRVDPTAQPNASALATGPRAGCRRSHRWSNRRRWFPAAASELPEDRVRKLFGLTSDDPLPPINDETLPLPRVPRRSSLFPTLLSIVDPGERPSRSTDCSPSGAACGRVARGVDEDDDEVVLARPKPCPSTSKNYRLLEGTRAGN